jgi:hypothetical protein
MAQNVESGGYRHGNANPTFRKPEDSTRSESEATGSAIPEGKPPFQVAASAIKFQADAVYGYDARVWRRTTVNRQCIQRPT